MFRQGKFYKHKNFIDACFYVTKVEYLDLNRYKLKIIWALQRGLQLMNLQDKIEVSSDQYKHYKEIEG